MTQGSAVAEAKEALREQFRDGDAWHEQVRNLIVGASRFLLIWIAVSVLCLVGAQVLFVAYPTGMGGYTQQEILRMLIPLIMQVVALLCLLGNVGGFRFVFRERARRSLGPTPTRSTHQSA